MTSHTSSRAVPSNVFGSWLSSLILTAGITTALAAPPKPSSATGGMLNPGDILFADSGDAVHGGFIIKVDPGTGEEVVVTSGGYLTQPFDVAVDASGAIIVSDTSGRLVHVDPDSGQQTLLKDNSDGLLGMPCGIGLDGRGGVMVANTRAILRVDTNTGAENLVASGGKFSVPIGIALNGMGPMYVLNTGAARQIIRINPQTGAQRVISQGGYLNNPQAVTMVGGTLYVTDVATPDGNFGIGRVLQIDAVTGAQTVVAEGGFLMGPVGIAGDGNGQLIVGDPYTINAASPDLYDGGIIRIDPATGAQTLIARGQDSYLNPRGVAVVPVR